MLKTEKDFDEGKTHQQIQKFYSDRRQDKYIVSIAQKKRSYIMNFLIRVYKEDKKAIRDVLVYIVGKKYLNMSRWDIDMAHEYVQRFELALKRMKSTGFSEGDIEVILERVRTHKIITLQDINILELLIFNVNEMFSTISRVLQTWTIYLNDKEL